MKGKLTNILLAVIGQEKIDCNRCYGRGTNSRGDICGVCLGEGTIIVNKKDLV